LSSLDLNPAGLLPGLRESLNDRSMSHPVSQHPRVVFVGAGSVVFTRQLLTDLFGFDDLPPLQIVLYDVDADRLQVAKGTADQVRERLGRPAEVIATLNRREALDGADFVINMIQVGGIDGTRADLEIPARYGLRQTIGDTTGIGGVFRGLRTFPVLSAIAEEMIELCPDAWFLNYTNPMAMNIWWLSLVAPRIKAVGLCHSVYWTVHDLCELIKVPIGEVDYAAGGVNHQAWLTTWERDGEDLYPLLEKVIADDPEMLRRVRVEIFRRVGCYPTETSEHSAEYLSWFLRSDEQIARYRLTPLEYLQISEDNVAEFRQARDDLAAGRPLELPREPAEYAPQVIHAMITGTSRRIHANTPNVGLIDNLPDRAVVEVPALVDAEGVHPLPFGPVPPVGAALNRSYLSVAELTVTAALTGDPELVRRAVLVDPNAASSISPEQIWAACDDLTAAHARYLPRSLGGELEL